MFKKRVHKTLKTYTYHEGISTHKNARKLSKEMQGIVLFTRQPRRENLRYMRNKME
jgi:hypothetical protein